MARDGLSTAYDPAIEPLTEEPITLSAEGLRAMYVIVKQAMRGRSQSVL